MRSYFSSDSRSRSKTINRQNKYEEDLFSQSSTLLAIFEGNFSFKRIQLSPTVMISTTEKIIRIIFQIQMRFFLSLFFQFMNHKQKIYTVKLQL